MNLGKEVESCTRAFNSIVGEALQATGKFISDFRDGYSEQRAIALQERESSYDRRGNIQRERHRCLIADGAALAVRQGLEALDSLISRTPYNE